MNTRGTLSSAFRARKRSRLNEKSTTGEKKRGKTQIQARAIERHGGTPTDRQTSSRLGSSVGSIPSQRAQKLIAAAGKRLKNNITEDPPKAKERDVPQSATTSPSIDSKFSKVSTGILEVISPVMVTAAPKPSASALIAARSSAMTAAKTMLPEEEGSGHTSARDYARQLAMNELPLPAAHWRLSQLFSKLEDAMCFLQKQHGETMTWKFDWLKKQVEMPDSTGRNCEAFTYEKLQIMNTILPDAFSYSWSSSGGQSVLERTKRPELMIKRNAHYMKERKRLFRNALLHHVVQQVPDVSKSKSETKVLPRSWPAGFDLDRVRLPPISDDARIPDPDNTVRRAFSTPEERRQRLNDEKQSIKVEVKELPRLKTTEYYPSTEAVLLERLRHGVLMDRTRDRLNLEAQYVEKAAGVLSVRFKEKPKKKPRPMLLKILSQQLNDLSQDVLGIILKKLTDMEIMRFELLRGIEYYSFDYDQYRAWRTKKP